METTSSEERTAEPLVQPVTQPDREGRIRTRRSLEL